MLARVKNCGLKTPEAIKQAAATGASFVGFVHHPDSPRHLALDEIKTLMQYASGRVKTVIVTVNPDNALLDELKALDPDYLQVHKVDEARASEIKQRTRLKLIIAVALRSARDAAIARALESKCDFLLLDNQEAGSGKAFDWSLIDKVGLTKPWFLAGGLTPENVAAAMRTTKARMADVSSGIEDSPGNKSLEKIAAFNAAVLDAPHG